MDYAEAVIAVNDGINDYSDGVYIINLVKILILHIHFAIYAVNGFDSAADLSAGNNGFYSFLNSRLYLGKELVSRFALSFKRIFNVFISHGVKIAYRKIFKLLFYRPDT